MLFKQGENARSYNGRLSRVVSHRFSDLLNLNPYDHIRTSRAGTALARQFF